MSAQDIKRLGRYIKQIDSLFPELVELKSASPRMSYTPYIDSAIEALGNARRSLVVIQIEHEHQLQEQEDDDRPYP